VAAASVVLWDISSMPHLGRLIRPSYLLILMNLFSKSARCICSGIIDVALQYLLQGIK